MGFLLTAIKQNYANPSFKVSQRKEIKSNALASKREMEFSKEYLEREYEEKKAFICREIVEEEKMLFQQTLDEDGETDKMLTELAESGVNKDALIGRRNS